MCRVCRRVSGVMRCVRCVTVSGMPPCDVVCRVCRSVIWQLLTFRRSLLPPSSGTKSTLRATASRQSTGTPGSTSSKVQLPAATQTESSADTVTSQRRLRQKRINLRHIQKEVRQYTPAEPIVLQLVTLRSLYDHLQRGSMKCAQEITYGVQCAELQRQQVSAVVLCV